MHLLFQPLKVMSNKLFIQGIKFDRILLPHQMYIIKSFSCQFICFADKVNTKGKQTIVPVYYDKCMFEFKLYIVGYINHMCPSHCMFITVIKDVIINN